MQKVQIKVAKKLSKIHENLDVLEKQIQAACDKCGRKREEVLLIGVTKTRTADEVNEAVAWGITDVGENKVQEIMDKYDHVPGDVKWHMIGHLQTNKVKYIIDKVALIHSVDKLKLAEEIDKRAKDHGLIAEVLVEVNAAGEESKFGTDIDGAKKLIEDVRTNCKNIKIKGLMTIAPFTEDPEDVRVYFKELKELFDEYKDIKDENMDFEHLSMGMSGDYAVAIEEGATMIRVGTAIFGARNYNI
ncbi:MAG: YggS family pyridoxal phosphate-dependent enzyme [Firmicutes bacterium]|nr:YggS family pyridoxal phosphate-dependent enzyme [Bacillota bacterium]